MLFSMLNTFMIQFLSVISTALFMFCCFNASTIFFCSSFASLMDSIFATAFCLSSLDVLSFETIVSCLWISSSSFFSISSCSASTSSVFFSSVSFVFSLFSSLFSSSIIASLCAFPSCVITLILSLGSVT